MSSCSAHRWKGQTPNYWLEGKKGRKLPKYSLVPANDCTFTKAWPFLSAAFFTETYTQARLLSPVKPSATEIHLSASEGLLHLPAQEDSLTSRLSLMKCVHLPRASGLNPPCLTLSRSCLVPITNAESGATTSSIPSRLLKLEISQEGIRVQSIESSSGTGPNSGLSICAVRTYFIRFKGRSRYPSPTSLGKCVQYTEN